MEWDKHIALVIFNLHAAYCHDAPRQGENKEPLHTLKVGVAHQNSTTSKN